MNKREYNLREKGETVGGWWSMVASFGLVGSLQLAVGSFQFAVGNWQWAVFSLQWAIGSLQYCDLLSVVNY